MRTEYVKNSRFINGIEVFDLGVEYVFRAERNGVMIEHHLAKLPKIALDGKWGGASEDVEVVINAIVHFPNVSTAEAVKQYGLMPKEPKEKKGKAA